MHAIGYSGPAALDDSDYLLDLTLPDPQPGPRDLRVRIEAVGLNPVDRKVRGRDVPENGGWRVLGWDAVGRVEALGPEAEGFAVGDRVWYAGALNRPGCNAQLHLVDARLAALAPRTLDPAQAAALPLTSITAWELLFDRLGLEPGPQAGAGESLLVVGAAGGVGSVLLQLARQLTGVNVVATASRPESQQWAGRCGAHHVINHHRPLRPQLEALGLSQVERVISLTHTGEHFEQLVDVLAPQGALALIDDPDPATINVLALKRKSLSLHWELMFTRSLYGTPDLPKQGQLLAQVAELVDGGRLFSTATQQLGPICAAKVTAGHRLLASDTTIGKLVLAGWPER